MKKCLKCAHEFESNVWYCPMCFWKPEWHNQVPIISSKYFNENNSFDAAYFVPLAEKEAGHFWFRMRNKLIIWVIRKYGKNLSSFLEIGCGTGFVLQCISKIFPKMRIIGSDIYLEGIEIATRRIKNGEFIQMDAREIPYTNEFDAVGAFDVIEHITEDDLVLKQINNALKTGGLLILTVPQHPWLWSNVDEYSCHVRRYDRRTLMTKLENAGFAILWNTSFVSILLPLFSLLRIFQSNGKNFDPRMELDINPILNCVLENFLNIEFWLIRCGLSFPAGGSLLIAATKLGRVDRKT